MAVVTTSVVFTDIVDSTALSSRLGPERANALFQQHFAVLRAAIKTHDGTEVKTLGDGIMAVFPGATAAVAAGIAIQQGVQRQNHRSQVPLAVRVGISTGEANTEGGEYFGVPVTDAAALCALATGSQILTSEVVRLLDLHPGHRFAPVDEAHADVLRLRANEVVWEPAGGPSDVPLPSRLAPTADEVSYAGRHDEAARLRDGVKAAETGERRVVLISGEPGIGKSRLCAEAARLAHDRGALVLHGQCDDDLAIPYQPWVEMVTHLLAHVPEAVDLVGGRSLAALSHLVPSTDREPAAAPAPVPETLDRFEVFAAVIAVLGAVGADLPLVLVIDDLQWADHQSLLLLRQLTVSDTPSRLFVLATYRDAELAPDDPLADFLARLRREPIVERMGLRGLDDDAVVELLEATTGRTLDDAGVTLAHAVRQETEGNPFFAIEVLRHLVESRTLIRDDGTWLTPGDLAQAGLPESIREVLGQRLRRLGEDTHRLLSAAAVIGREFDLSTVAAVCGLGEDDAIDAAEPAVRVGILLEAGARGRLAFAHAIVEHTLYDELGATRRWRLHRRVAETLESMLGEDPGDHVSELARHWSVAAEAPEAAKAVEYARQAGARSVARLAPDEAAGWFRQALDLHDQHGRGHDEVRCRILIGLGEAQRQAGDAGYRRTLLDAADAARALESSPLLVEAALGNNRGFFSMMAAVDNERVEVLEAALAMVTDDTNARARLLATLAVELSWTDDWERRRSMGLEAAELARASGDPATAVAVLPIVTHALFVAEMLPERIQWAAEAMAAATELGSPLLRATALDVGIWAAFEACDTAGVAARLDELFAVIDRVPEPTLRWAATFQRTLYRLITGSAAESADALEVLQQAGGGVPESDIVWATLLQSQYIREHRHDELLPLLELARDQFPDIPAVRPGLASLYAEVGRVEEAADLLAADADDGFTRFPYDRLWLGSMTMWARVAALVDHPGAAAVLFDHLRPFHDHAVSCEVPLGSGVVDAYLARLALTVGREDEAEHRFRLADEACRRMGARYWAGENALHWHRWRLVRGDDDARSALEQLAASARADGFTVLETAVSKLL